MRFTKQARRGMLLGLLVALVLLACAAQKTPTVQPTPPRVIKIIDKNPVKQPTESPPPICKAHQGTKLQMLTTADGWVLAGTGFQPGEEVVIDSSCATPVKSRRSRDNGEVVNAKGQFRISYPRDISSLSQIDPECGLRCDIRVVHAKGVACLTVHITAKITQLK